MAYQHLREFIQVLDQQGELYRISHYVNPRLEMAEITDRISKTKNGGKAILFENTGSEFPVLMNAYGSEKRMCMALRVRSLDDIAREIESLFKLLSSPKENLLDKLRLLPRLNEFAGWMPKVRSGRSECQQVVMKEPDLNRLPIITCWPKDGGPFITLPIIHTKDLNSGIRNVGMYRMQIFGPALTGMHWHKHKVSAKHFSEYKKQHQRMPVAVALGGDPVYAYAATAPLPENVDEYMLAGFLRKKRVELVKCITQPALEVPADSDFIIEGYVDPDEEMIWEGPFGDHTGYYSLPDWYPRFHVTAITHRKDAIYPATIVGIPPQEDAWLGKATERIFLAPIKMMMIPEMVDMEMPVEGVFHNLVIAQIHKEYPGQALKVMNAMWGAGQMMFNKILVLVDEGVRIQDYLALAKYVFSNLDPASDIYYSQGPMDVLDHSCTKLGFGGKMCLDGTRKWAEEVSSPSNQPNLPAVFPVAEIKLKFPEIREINSSLIKNDIPCIFISIEKNRKNHVRELHFALCSSFSQMQAVKVVVYVEQTVDPLDLTVAMWRFCNNLDPRRDNILYQDKNNPAIACIGFDGTRKTNALDGFQRDWPNIIVADQETIEAVDAYWSSLGIGEFIPSPSLKFRDQLYGLEAVATNSDGYNSQ